MSTPPHVSVLEIRFEDAAIDPDVALFCPGFETGRWRSAELVRDIFERHLISFALTYSEASRVTGETAATALKRAAQTVYDTDKYDRRGEFGELILHALMKDFYGSIPAVSKIFYKDSKNDTVKGFDAVHVVPNGEAGVDLWLGEVKFYVDVRSAIRDLCAEIELHLDARFLRSEFMMISPKIDTEATHIEGLSRLIHQNTSLDAILDRIVMPMLLVYESPLPASATSIAPTYVNALEAEARDAWEYLGTKLPDGIDVRLHLLLLPVPCKADLVREMHEKLTHWQEL